ncbi:MAG: rhomboid family intramembrane serine protease [Bacteroidales bacterium]|nr:rhomboid family intramembrane serine protease [Bacteroidales bacterium]MCF8387915.1 rhomboid family intramembrane serine protease [Bacteroidales bacterium]MCF8396971.1 rhomboid family intramembrane serine protease [Bacteroidales bacterium]
MTYFIISITVVVSLLAFNNPALFDKLKFNAYLIKHSREPWRFLTYGLIHAGWGHLLINMFVLFSFGDFVESVFKMLFSTRGLLYYFLLYVGGILFSVIFDYGKQKENIYYNAVGASGAVSAVVFSSIIINPTGTIMFLLLPIPIPSFVFGILYLVYSYYMAKRGEDNVGHSAHFWGAVYGIVFTLVINPGFFIQFWRSITG